MATLMMPLYPIAISSMVLALAMAFVPTIVFPIGTVALCVGVKLTGDGGFFLNDFIPEKQMTIWILLVSPRVGPSSTSSVRHCCALVT